MKIMLLAAGRGVRMRSLTAQQPKPLIRVAGKPLIVHQLERVKAAGFTDVVINLGYRGAQIRDAVGNGAHYGLDITYSEEGYPALETGGGVHHALSLLGNAPFAVINSDVWTDLALSSLAETAARMRVGDLGHLILVPNPAHNQSGDFALDAERVRMKAHQMYTFSGISVLTPTLFTGCQPGSFPLAPLLRRAIDASRLSGSLHAGLWMDIGTPERLAELERHLTPIF